MSDLKAELKLRSLPVSGSKTVLIERLKPHLELLANKTQLPTTPRNQQQLQQQLIQIRPSASCGSLGLALAQRGSKESSPVLSLDTASGEMRMKAKERGQHTVQYLCSIVFMGILFHVLVQGKLACVKWIASCRSTFLTSCSGWVLLLHP